MIQFFGVHKLFVVDVFRVTLDALIVDFGFSCESEENFINKLFWGMFEDR